MVELSPDAAELIAWYRTRTERAHRQIDRWRAYATQLEAAVAELRRERDDAREALAELQEAHTLLRMRVADLEATRGR